MNYFWMALSAAVLAIPAAASAEDWRLYASSSNGGLPFYYDADSVQARGQIKRVWIRSDHSGQPAYPYSWEKFLVEVDCAGGTTATISYEQVRRSDGVLTRGDATPDQRRPQPIREGSMFAPLRSVVCAHR